MIDLVKSPHNVREYISLTDSVYLTVSSSEILPQNIKDIKMLSFKNKGIESLPQSQIFKLLYLWNLMLKTFDISSSEYLIYQNL